MISNKHVPYLIFGVLGLLICLVSVRCLCSNTSIKEGMTEEVLIFFYADWCGHCKQFKPEVEKYKGVSVQSVDCTNPGSKEKALMKEYDVTGFPSMFYKSGSNQATFNKQRTVEGINEFVDECRVK